MPFEDNFIQMEMTALLWKSYCEGHGLSIGSLGNGGSIASVQPEKKLSYLIFTLTALYVVRAEFDPDLSLKLLM